MIKNIIDIAQHNLDGEVNRFRKVNRDLINPWTMKVNAILKEIKSDNITETSNRLIKACVIFVGRKVALKPKPKNRKCSERTLVEKKNTTVNTRVTKTY